MRRGGWWELAQPLPRGPGRVRKHIEIRPEHKDVYVAIRNAFMSARRQLQDYAKRLRGEVKHHEHTEPEG